MKLLTVFMLIASLTTFADQVKNDLVKLQLKVCKMNWLETELMSNSDLKELRSKAQYHRKKLLNQVCLNDPKLNSMRDDCAEAWDQLQNDTSNGQKQEAFLIKCLEINAHLIIKSKDNIEYKNWVKLLKKLESEQLKLYKVLDDQKAKKFKSLIEKLQKLRT